MPMPPQSVKQEQEYQFVYMQTNDSPLLQQQLQQQNRQKPTKQQMPGSNFNGYERPR